MKSKDFFCWFGVTAAKFAKISNQFAKIVKAPRRQKVWDWTTEPWRLGGLGVGDNECFHIFATGVLTPAPGCPEGLLSPAQCW